MARKTSRLECGGAFVAHRSLTLLGSKTGSCYAAQAGLLWLGSIMMLYSLLGRERSSHLSLPSGWTTRSSKSGWAESSIHDVGSELRNIIICLRKAAALRQTARSGSKHLQAEVLEMWNLGVEPSEALGVEALATDLLWPSSWHSPTQPGPGLCLVPPPFIPTHGELLQVPLEATRSSMGNTQHQLVTAGGGLLGRTEAPRGMVASPAASPLLRAKDGGWPEADISSVSGCAVISALKENPTSQTSDPQPCSFSSKSSSPAPTWSPNGCLCFQGPSPSLCLCLPRSLSGLHPEQWLRWLCWGLTPAEPRALVHDEHGGWWDCGIQEGRDLCCLLRLRPGCIADHPEHPGRSRE
ncbi:hypothetical protein AAY473_004779 [Plecturocebus cupreus]